MNRAFLYNILATFVILLANWYSLFSFLLHHFQLHYGMIESKCIITSHCKCTFKFDLLAARCFIFLAADFSHECACVYVCAQTLIHAGHPNAGGNAIRGQKCAAMMAVAFFYDGNVTMSSTASMAAMSAAAVRISSCSHSPSSSFPFRILILTMTNVF